VNDRLSSLPLPRLIKLSLELTLLLPLVACHERRPPTPTAEQSDQLNEADEMLNDLANKEEPEAKASGPSKSSD
jgi:hypothetical protein